MKNYKMVLQYEGTRYHGWQKQGNTKDTIQAKLEGVLSRLDGKPVEVHGAGRTDAGTHAAGQVANFYLQSEPDAVEVLYYLNTYLPEDIGVISVAEVPIRFHSRLNAVRKTYQYRLKTGDTPMVLERRFLAEYPEKLDIDAMREAAKKLLGRHDFASFCANPRMKKSTVRTLLRLDIEEHPGELRFLVCGSGFLHHMVRILVGTLCEIGCGKRTPGSIEQLLQARNRSLAGETMPAKGLMLMEVEYE
ncbi:MAG: tRNA pseudouridine(38-40) synthase TruA [Clostridia bacterium]|nr:tRNA pseudouridine(38-40) synthase TruA [Clostridia bacterium]